MVHLRSTCFFSLSFIILECASAFQTTFAAPSSRASVQTKIPEASSGPGIGNLGLEPRADSATNAEAYITSSAGGRVLTSSMPASVCGYVNGVLSSMSSIECVSDGQCVFHTSDSKYPNMVGCCYDSNPNNCRFETTCYDGSQVKATPSLALLLDNNFDVLCTRESNSACVTWTYPELEITDYGCGPTATLQEIYLTASTSQLEYRSVTGYFYYSTIATVDPITVNGAFISSYETGVRSASSIIETGAPRSSTSGLSGTSRATSTVNNSSENGSRESSKSSNTGAIVGGVVGGVVGLGLIIGATWACLWYSRRKKHNLQGTSPPFAVRPQMQPIPPVLAEAEGTLGKPVQRYSAVGGPHNPPPYIPELPVNDSYMKSHEMDSHNSVAELPAGRR